MNFTLSAVLHMLGAFEVRRVIGTAWHGQYVVIRTADADILSVHPTKGHALTRMANYDCGIEEPPKPKADRLASLENVPTLTLAETLEALDRRRDWRTAQDIRATLAAR